MRPIRFNLKTVGDHGEEIEIRSLADLRENINLNDFESYLANGALVRWLRGLDQQVMANRVEAASKQPSPTTRLKDALLAVGIEIEDDDLRCFMEIKGYAPAKKHQAEPAPSHSKQDQKKRKGKKAPRSSSHAIDSSSHFISSPLFSRVQNTIVNQLGIYYQQVTPNADFLDDLGADSLDAVELIMAFEEEFGMAIPEEDVDRIRTVGNLVSYLESRGYS